MARSRALAHTLTIRQLDRAVFQFFDVTSKMCYISDRRVNGKKIDYDMHVTSQHSMIRSARTRGIARDPKLGKNTVPLTYTQRQIEKSKILQRITIPQRIFLCKEISKGTPYDKIVQLWMSLYVDERPPSKAALSFLMKRFKQHGTVHDVQWRVSGRLPTGVNFENTIMVFESLQNYPNHSTRERAAMLGISYPTLQHIMKELKACDT